MKIHKQFFITIVINILLQSSLYASTTIQPPYLQTVVNQYLEQHKFNEHISTVALTAQCKGFSYSRPSSAYAGKLGQNNFPLTDNQSIFQVGSVTKSFVEVVLLQLENEPQYNFSLNDDMEKWFPEYPMWYGIKIKQLLNMTSGIPDYSDDPSFIFAVMLNPYKNWRLEDILQYEINKPLKFTPGSSWNYSNTNYTLLGLLIQKVTSNDPGFEITNRIIKKLDLKNTFYVVDQPDKRLSDRLVHGYTKISGIFVDTTGFSLSTANTSGAIISTSEDINQYVRALFAPGNLLTDSELKRLTSFVSEETGQPINEPTKDQPNVYGLGLVGSYSQSNGIQYVYEGSTPGYRFLFAYSPIKSISTIAALNSDVVGDEWKLLDSTTDKISEQCK